MNKKEYEIEEEDDEREMVDHWHHNHPLALVEIGREYLCSGCVKFFRRGEKGYGCSQKCGYDVHLHEDCAEAPRNIRYAMHPQHTLTQRLKLTGAVKERCSICGLTLGRISYICTGAVCTFAMHIRCAQGSDMMYGAEEQSSSSIIHHPSHPEHQLLFLRRSCSFKCDACGTTGAKGSSYTCTTPSCQYWIHQRCASLPHTIQRGDHHHPLSLSFHVPRQYLRYHYRCEVCRKELIPKDWIYHCELCSYAVHLTCAFTKYIPTTREKGIMEFPINDMAVGEDLIGAFLRRQGVDAHTNTLILDHQNDVDYEFHHHKLMLVSSSSSSFQEEEEEENGDDDDDEEDNSCRKSELICDGCITPIFLKQTSSSSFSGSSSSSSKDNNYYYYMRCSIKSCKYYLHLTCFHMPRQLSSLPLIDIHDHSFLLQSGDKLKPWEWTYCSVCSIPTNGLYYVCTKCYDFKVDIKCASMPETIYHKAHPNHPLNLLTLQDTLRRRLDSCDGCGHLIWHDGYNSYACGSCDFIVHFKCAGLPASTTRRRWDKHHPLLFMHDATLNRPGDFYCNQCEKLMHPKHWMYHCRSCDISFHPECFKTTSGWFRNIKLGQKYVITGAHRHPLTFQLLTTKRLCDVCGGDRHDTLGFYCASCIFFICFYSCGVKMIKDGNVEAID